MDREISNKDIIYGFMGLSFLKRIEILHVLGIVDRNFLTTEECKNEKMLEMIIPRLKEVDFMEKFWNLIVLAR